MSPIALSNLKLSLSKLQLALVILFAALLAGGVAANCWMLTSSFYFEVSMFSSASGTAQLFYDIGQDMNERDSAKLPVGGGESSVVYRFPLSKAQYRGFRFDPLEHGNASIDISHARIVDALGRTVRNFSPSMFTPSHDISHFEITGSKISLVLGPADNDAALALDGAPLTLRGGASSRFVVAAQTFLLYFLCSLALAILALKLSSFLERPFKRPLLWAGALFSGGLIYSLWAASIGWNNVAAGPSDFRQAQTAISCFYMLHAPLSLAYETPVLGAPWSVPMEFPLYQWIVAAVVRFTGGMPLDQAGRLVSLAFFVLTLVPVYFLLGTLRLAKPHRLVFLSVIAVSPYYIFWGRDFMIETTALCLSVAYLASAALYAERPRKSLAALACVLGVLAALVKITTFTIFVFPVAFFLTRDWLQLPFRFPRWLDIRQRFTVLSLLAGVPVAIALWWTHYADQVKEQNSMGHYLTSSYLMQWNFGTLDQKLSLNTWRTILARAPSLLTHDKLFWIACVLALIITRRRWKEVAACLMLYIGAPLMFTNLHFQHEYYMCANGIFLLAAVGFCIVSILERPGGQKIGLALALVAALLAAADHQSQYAPRQRVDHQAFTTYVKEYLNETKPDSVIIYLGFDWSSVWPYYSERRALMIPDWGFVTDSDVRKALANLRGYKIGGIITTGHSVYPLDLLIANMKTLGLDTNNVRQVN